MPKEIRISFHRVREAAELLISLYGDDALLQAQRIEQGAISKPFAIAVRREVTRILRELPSEKRTSR